MPSFLLLLYLPSLCGKQCCAMTSLGQRLWGKPAGSQGALQDHALRKVGSRGPSQTLAFWCPMCQVSCFGEAQCSADGNHTDRTWRDILGWARQELCQLRVPPSSSDAFPRHHWCKAKHDNGAVQPSEHQLTPSAVPPSALHQATGSSSLGKQLVGFLFPIHLVPSGLRIFWALLCSQLPRVAQAVPQDLLSSGNCTG